MVVSIELLQPSVRDNDFNENSWEPKVISKCTHCRLVGSSEIVLLCGVWCFCLNFLLTDWTDRAFTSVRKAYRPRRLRLGR